MSPGGTEPHPKKAHFGALLVVYSAYVSESSVPFMVFCSSHLCIGTQSVIFYDRSHTSSALIIRRLVTCQASPSCLISKELSATRVGDLMKFALDSLLSTVVNLEELMLRETMREATTLKSPALEETVGE
jgi:hypothetical protein